MPTVNATSNSVLEPIWSPGLLPSARVLRQWSAPATILAITNFANEEILLFHAIQQARRSAARVLLVHVLPSDNVLPGVRRWIQPGETGSLAESARACLQRMARQLRWVGIQCEPLLLRGSVAREIPLVAKARGADRILMDAACQKRAKGTAPRTFAEDLLPGISVPICTVGQCEPPERAGAPRPGNITLALSLRSDSAVPIAFASRLAQEHQAKLTVMHVFDSEDKVCKDSERTPLAVASQLPAERLREAELMCPLEIAVARGDPATEILKAGTCINQEFIVLGPVGQPGPGPAGRASTVHRIIREARCPVIVLGRFVQHSEPG
jgi:nucleotide-binding universal stress UspA family protein